MDIMHHLFCCITNCYSNVRVRITVAVCTMLCSPQHLTQQTVIKNKLVQDKQLYVFFTFMLLFFFKINLRYKF